LGARKRSVGDVIWGDTLPDEMPWMFSENVEGCNRSDFRKPSGRCLLIFPVMAGDDLDENFSIHCRVLSGVGLTKEHA